jgi:hypothetical protein
MAHRERNDCTLILFKKNFPCQIKTFGDSTCTLLVRAVIVVIIIIIIIIIIIFLHELGRLICSGIDALPYGLCRRELYVPGRASQAVRTVKEKPV